MVRTITIFSAILLLLVVIFLIDALALPSYVLPTGPYAIPVVIAAYYLRPRLVAVVAVYSMIFQAWSGWIDSDSPVTVALFELGLVIIAYMATVISIRTLREAREKALVQRQAAELDAIISAMPDGLLICDSSGDIARTNYGADEILGYSMSEWQTPAAEQILALRPESGDGKSLPWEAFALARALRGERVRGAVAALHSAGRTFWTLWGASPILGADNTLLGAVATVTDMTAMHEREEEQEARIRTLSHDLRTPLASISASGESLLQKDVEWTEEERDEYAGTIVRETRRLSRLVDNMLDLSRIEAGALRPELDWYPLDGLISDVLGRLRPITMQHPMAVNIDVGLPPVQLDYVKIDQVLSNLVENAAKYSPTGAEIQVSARHNGDEIVVEVADRGPGIPQEALSLLFKPFYRLDIDGPRARGTGLGLAIAKGLVEAHGGRIWVENRQDGGTKFIFALPVGSRDEGALNHWENKA